MNTKKDLLKLHFHKYLAYKNSAIMILFMYFIAVLIPFLTGQLNLKNFIDMILVLIVSSVFITIIILFLNEFDYHLKKIPEEMKKLE